MTPPMPGTPLKTSSIRSFQRFQIVAKGPAQQLRVGQPHIFNAQAVDHPGQCRVSGAIHTFHQVVVGFFTKSFHIYNIFPVPIQVEQVGRLVDKSPADEFFQRCLGKAVDVQRIPAGHQGKQLDLLGLAGRVRAVKHFHIVGLADHRLTAAHRTDLRDLQGTASRQISAIWGMIMLALYTSSSSPIPSSRLFTILTL